MNWRKLFSIDERSSSDFDLIIKLHLSLGFGLCGHISIAQGVINNGASIVMTSGSTMYVDGGSSNGNFKNQDNGGFTGTVNNSGTLYVSGDWINNSTANVFPSNSGNVRLIGENQAIKGATTTYFNNLTLLGSGVKTLEINTLTGGGFASPTGVLALNSLPLDLNTHTLTINNPNTSAITRTTGFIISETNVGTNSSTIAWNAGSVNGTYVFPFGLLTAPNYIPLTITKSSGNTSMSVSTRMTFGSDNLPWESTVTNMYSTVIGGSGEVATVIDRWYDISSVATFTGAVDFTYRGVENTTATPTAIFGAQNWNGMGWLPIVGNGPGVTSGTAVVSIPDQTLGGTTSTPWVLTTVITPLPVELISFNGECTSNSTRLYWATASEINNDYFTVERSENGTSFYPIGEVDGAGNSAVLLEYEFRDPNPVTNVSYYRLKQTDFNGANKTSPLISIAQCKETDNGLLVYPNPASDEVFISLPNYKNNSFLMKLYDEMGCLVVQTPMQSANSSVSTSSLEDGVYHLIIQSQEQVYTNKIVISH